MSDIIGTIDSDQDIEGYMDAPVEIDGVFAPKLEIVTNIIATGPRGERGLQGAPGSGGDLNFVYTQMTPSAIWTIVHELGKKPSVTVIDSAGTLVSGDVTYPDMDTVVIDFDGTAFSGEATLN